MRKNEINGMFDYCLYQLNLARRKEYLFNKMKNVVLGLRLNNFTVKHGILMYMSDVECEHRLTV
jgi:hypothetical protein